MPWYWEVGEITFELGPDCKKEVKFGELKLD